MTLTPKTIFCYECRKGFRTEKGCRAHGSAKSHQWMTPSGAVVSISVPTAPSGLAAELSSQVVTLAAHVKGERIMSQFMYCPLCARRWGTWFELNRVSGFFNGPHLYRNDPCPLAISALHAGTSSPSCPGRPSTKPMRFAWTPRD